MWRLYERALRKAYNDNLSLSFQDFLNKDNSFTIYNQNIHWHAKFIKP